jgi:hypothetical protein
MVIAANSRLYILSLATALAIFAIIGCKGGDPLRLPNGYAIMEANSRDVFIVHGSRYEIINKGSLGRVGVRDKYVFGTVVMRDRGPAANRFDYFILDTQLRDMKYYGAFQNWTEALEARGIGEVEIQAPYNKFEMSTPWIIVGCVFLFFGIVAVFVVGMTKYNK